MKRVEWGKLGRPAFSENLRKLLAILMIKEDLVSITGCPINLAKFHKEHQKTVSN